MIPALEVRYGLQKATILSQGTLYTIFLLIVAQTGWYSIGTLRTMSFPALSVLCFLLHGVPE